MISPKTAGELNVEREVGNQTQQWPNKVVEIDLNGRKVEGPVWIQPGMADYTVALALGYGRSKTGRIGTGSGFNAYTIRTSENLYYASGAKVTVTSETSVLATTQSHWQMEGRPVVREANYEEYPKEPRISERIRMEKRRRMVALSIPIRSMPKKKRQPRTQTVALPGAWPLI